MGKQEGSWPLKVDKAVVVQARTTQRVWVKWPALENDEFQTLSNSSEHNIVLVPNDLVGHCSIAAPGEYSREWLQTMKAPREVDPAPTAPTSGRVYKIVLKDNVVPTRAHIRRVKP